MRILYLCHRIPYPPDKGEKIRAFHQIRILSERHEIHLACFVDDPSDWPHVETLKRYCARVEAVARSRGTALARAFGGLLRGRSLSVSAFGSNTLRERVSDIAAASPPEAVFVFSSTMAPYAPDSGAAPVVMDFVDVDSEKWKMYAGRHRWPLSWVYQLEADRLRRFEEDVARRASRSIFVSEAEARLLSPWPGRVPPAVIPSGVDLEYFAPADPTPINAEGPLIAFVGGMGYFPNVDAVIWFCDEVMPRILEEEPRARFRIVGRRPARAVVALGRRRGIEVTGAVPDVRPHLTDAALVVAPFRVSRGLQSKVLEAMAMGRPVVGTPLAFQGFASTPTGGVRVVSEADAMAREVLTLLRRPELRKQLGLEGRLFVERFHRWEDHGRALESLLEAAREQSGAA